MLAIRGLQPYSSGTRNRNVCGSRHQGAQYGKSWIAPHSNPRYRVDVILRVLILGAGDHGQMVAGYLLQDIAQWQAFEIVGFLDDNPDLRGRQFLGLPVLGAIRDWRDVKHDAAIVGIGDNRVRARIFADLACQGERFVNAVHSAAVLGPGVTLGCGVTVGAGSVISLGANVGDNAILSSNCVVGHHAQIGAHTHIGPCAALAGRVEVGEGTLIGAGAAVVPGCRIGRWCVIGAGAAVVSPIPDGVVAVGVPARAKRMARSSGEM